MKKKILSIFLAALMIVLMLPVNAIATEDVVYFTLSSDALFLKSEVTGEPMTYVPVKISELEKIDLEAYGLGEYLYDKDGDGEYEITALHLLVYAYKTHYDPNFSQNGDGGFSLTQTPAHSFFTKFWGHDCNLNYYLNGEYPIDEELSAGSTVPQGATSDRIVLKAGDILNMMMFDSWSFYGDPLAGFHFFTDSVSENHNIVHKISAKKGEPVTLGYIRAYGNVDVGENANHNFENGVKVYYSKNAFEDETILDCYPEYAEYDCDYVVTDENGEFSITFEESGTWYLWTVGGYSETTMNNDFSDFAIVSAPAYAVVNVESEEEPVVYGDVDENGKVEAFDASLILQYVVEKISENDITVLAADVDGNGKVEAYDASLVLQYVVEKIPSFPAETK